MRKERLTIWNPQFTSAIWFNIGRLRLFSREFEKLVSESGLDSSNCQGSWRFLEVPPFHYGINAFLSWLPRRMYRGLGEYVLVKCWYYYIYSVSFFFYLWIWRIMVVYLLYLITVKLSSTAISLRLRSSIRSHHDSWRWCMLRSYCSSLLHGRSRYLSA